MYVPNSSANSASSSTVKCCEFYLRNNWCGYGLRCRFSHQVPQHYSAVYHDYLSPSHVSANINSSTLQLEEQVDVPPPQPSLSIEEFHQVEGHPEEVKNPQVQAISAQDAAERNQRSPKKRVDVQLQPCRYYVRDSWCPFGNQCRFSHGTVKPNVSPKSKSNNKFNKSTGNGNREQRPANRPLSWRERRMDNADVPKNKQKVCHYFLKKTCRNGEKCRYLHAKDESAAAAEVVDTSPIEGVAKNVEKIENDTVTGGIPVGRAPCLKPEYYLKDLDENGLKEIRELEISQMKKRIIKENLVELDDGACYIVTIIPTDPDWPYDVREVKLRMKYPVDYPKEVFQAHLECVDNEDLPSTLIRHISDSIIQWLNTRQQMNQDAGKVELMFRPFLKWLDKNLEELFTCGLKKTKRDIDARAAGIEFVPFHHLPGYNASDAAQDQTKSGENQEESKEQSNLLINNSLNTTPEQTLIKDDASHFLLDTMDLLQITKKGTEMRLCDLQLGENIASVVCQNLQLSIRCTRCKTQHDIFVAPRRQNLIPCTKCHQRQLVTYRPAMIHARAAILGYLDLEGCQAFDLPLFDATFSVSCLNCDKQRSANGIHYAQMWSTWCYNCNVKLEIFVGSFKFQILRPGTVTGNGSVNIIKLEKKDKKVKDPAIQEGKPLPNNGTCKHYKKSYRWFRFPCCGKAYPCDLCHNEKELEHEMKMANRIICGYCAKEQPFSNKPCLACSSDMTQSIKGHWEGGKGCRDKVKMSRDDRQKYTGLNKTTAKSVKDRKDVLKS